MQGGKSWVPSKTSFFSAHSRYLHWCSASPIFFAISSKNRLVVSSNGKPILLSWLIARTSHLKAKIIIKPITNPTNCPKVCSKRWRAIIGVFFSGFSRYHKSYSWPRRLEIMKYNYFHLFDWLSQKTFCTYLRMLGCCLFCSAKAGVVFVDEGLIL